MLIVIQTNYFSYFEKNCYSECITTSYISFDEPKILTYCYVNKNNFLVENNSESYKNFTENILIKKITWSNNKRYTSEKYYFDNKSLEFDIFSFIIPVLPLKLKTSTSEKFSFIGLTEKRKISTYKIEYALSSKFPFLQKLKTIFNVNSYFLR